MTYNIENTSFNLDFVASLKNFKEMVKAFPNYLPEDEKREEKLKEVWDAAHPKKTEEK